MTVVEHELKIQPKYLDASIEKHIKDAVCNLKEGGIFNRMCITNIRNVVIKCIKVTNGNSDTIAHLKIEADYFHLKIRRILQRENYSCQQEKNIYSADYKPNRCFRKFQSRL
jgi:hypothetical protein